MDKHKKSVNILGMLRVKRTKESVFWHPRVDVLIQLT
jgi:hypothetical protein